MKLDGYKNKKEAISDLFWKLAPPISHSCNQKQVILTLKGIQDQSRKNEILG